MALFDCLIRATDIGRVFCPPERDVMDDTGLYPADKTDGTKFGHEDQGESLRESGICFVEFVLIEFVYHDEYECGPSDRCGHHDCDPVVVCTDHCRCRSYYFRSSLLLLFRLLAWKMSPTTENGQFPLPVMIATRKPEVGAKAMLNKVNLTVMRNRPTRRMRGTAIRTNPLGRTRTLTRW